MPYHLPPLSRRQFLASLAAGAGLLTWREAGAAPAVDPERWVLLADTHIAADRTKVHRSAKMAANLERAIREIITLERRPAGVLLDGDAAFLGGLPGDYTTMGELLQPLAEAKIATHLTLGNHDHRQNFREGLLRGTGRTPLESRQVSVIEAARANWFLLDSLDRTNSTPGVLGQEQRDWLARALDARPDKPALVVVHHDVHAPNGKKPGLIDAESLFAVLAPRKQVKAVIYGHTHVWTRTQREGIHLINLPPVAYVFDAQRPNGWVDLRLEDNGAVLTLRAFNEKHRQHGEKVELAWR